MRKVIQEPLAIPQTDRGKTRVMIPDLRMHSCRVGYVPVVVSFLRQWKNRIPAEAFGKGITLERIRRCRLRGQEPALENRVVNLMVCDVPIGTHFRS